MANSEVHDASRFDRLQTESLIFDFESTPSRKDGISFVDELKLRRVFSLFIFSCGIRLEFPPITTCTAIVLMQRFFCRTSFQSCDRLVICMTCLFLASKIEETPKKLRDIINVAYYLRFDEKLPIGSKYWGLRDQLIEHEHLISRTLAFELTFDHPHKYLLNYLKAIEDQRSTHERPLQQLSQTAWNFLNDSYSTVLCLEYLHSIHKIAVACLYLAATSLQVELPSGTLHWWEAFDASLTDIQKICQCILDLYEHPIKLESHLELITCLQAKPDE